MSEYAFQFAILRYIHDTMTQEFINIGIVVYCREARYLRVSINTRYGRLSDAFRAEVNGGHYRRMVSHISRQVDRMHSRFQQLEMFEELPQQIEVVLTQILPPSDSSLIFDGYGGGVAEDLDVDLDRL
jgi:hypothetical protein